MNYLIAGASRGLGDAFARGLPRTGDTVFLISRSEPASLGLQDGVNRNWIRADLSRNNAAQIASSSLEDHGLDFLIYNAGIWEQDAFSNNYNLENVTENHTRDIIQVNLTSAIALVTALLPNLRGSSNPKIVLIGSVNGLENTGMPEVAYNASKFGLRGVGHGLREHLRKDRIAVTIINPGSIAWNETQMREDLIPPSDLVNLVRCVLDTSRRTVVKEIDVPAMLDKMA